MAKVLVELFGQAMYRCRINCLFYDIPADAALKSTWELLYAEKTLRYSNGQIISLSLAASRLAGRLSPPHVTHASQLSQE